MGPRFKRGRAPFLCQLSMCSSKGPKGTHDEPLNLGLGKAGAHVAKEEQGCAEGKLWLCEFFFPSFSQEVQVLKTDPLACTHDQPPLP